jgi:glucose/arabinose dehydrogenase
MRHIVHLLFGLAFATTATAQTVPADLTLTTVTSSVSAPVAIRAPNDGSGRIFIVSQLGTIRIFKNGALVATPFLTVSVNSGGEGGLLGLAFHPNYGKVGLPHNDEFYVAYTRPSGQPQLGSTPDQVIARYTVSANPDVANASGTIVLRVPDLASNHNGGDIHFGPDGYLYYSMGDGGPQGNPHGFAQCLWKKAANNDPATCGPGGSGTQYFLLGKILRIDVDNRGGAVTADMCGSSGISPAQYSIPATNPHVGTTNTCDEIYLHGFRNPWRFSFDRATGDLWIGDVGQGNREEVDLRVNGSTQSTFYGWHCYEGTAVYTSTGICSPVPAHVLPVMEYTHATQSRCAITGGFRFRGPIAPLAGAYIFADTCSSEIYVGVPGAGGTWSFTVWRNDTNGYGTYAGFGEDEAGNLYVAHGQDGIVYKISSDVIFEHGFE